MPNLLSQLNKEKQARLLEDLNYMNIEEIRGFCSARGIPYKILAEYPNGKVKATKDTDRKPIILAHVRHYLKTGRSFSLNRSPYSSAVDYGGHPKGTGSRRWLLMRIVRVSKIGTGIGTKSQTKAGELRGNGMKSWCAKSQQT
jgi:hypothetical protein